jgi:hypothetical protein
MYLFIAFVLVVGGPAFINITSIEPSRAQKRGREVTSDDRDKVEIREEKSAEGAEGGSQKSVMQRNRRRNLAATHDDVTAALPHTFEAVFAKEIAQLRARKDTQPRHASLQAL